VKIKCLRQRSNTGRIEMPRARRRWPLYHCWLSCNKVIVVKPVTTMQ